jgi:hypothetical protein
MATKEPEVGMKVRFRNAEDMCLTDAMCNRAYLSCLIRNWGDYVFRIEATRTPHEGATLVRLSLNGKPLTAVWNREQGKKPSWYKLEAHEDYWFYLERYLVLVN